MKTVFDEIVKNKLRMYELELKTLERLDSKLKDFLDTAETILPHGSGLSFNKLFKISISESRMVAIRDPKYLLEYLLKSMEDYMSGSEMDYLSNIDIDGYHGIVSKENDDKFSKYRQFYIIKDTMKMLHFEYSALPNQHAGRPDKI